MKYCLKYFWNIQIIPINFITTNLFKYRQYSTIFVIIYSLLKICVGNYILSYFGSIKKYVSPWNIPEHVVVTKS